MINGFDTVDPNNTGNEELPNLNFGKYDSLEIQKIKIFQGTRPGKTHLKYFKCTFVVTHDANGHKAGDLVQMFETIEGGLPYHMAQAAARVKRLLGAIAGISDAAEVKTKVTGQDLALAVSDAQPFSGRIVGATVSGKNARFPDVVCEPVTNSGTPVPSEVTQVKAVVAPPVPVAVDHTARAIAAGWAVHPTAPDYMFLGQDVKSKLDVAAGKF
jgi:hypothetical protein